MDKKQKKGGATINQRMIQGTTLREEKVGLKRVDASSMLRMQHLQKLATWAGVEAGIPPLGALFGHRLAASAEAEGVPLDPSTFVCHRCESILQPGFNCTVRVEKIARNTIRRKKSHISSQNNVVYKCHFCSHHNLLRGTQRGHVKGLLASKQKQKPETDSIKSLNISEIKLKEKLDENVGDDIFLDKSHAEGLLASKPMPKPETDSSKSLNVSEIKLEEKQKLDENVRDGISLDKSPLTLLERLANSSKRKRKRNGSEAKKANLDIPDSSAAALNSVEKTSGGSSKQKRKGWSSLKEIAERNETRSSHSIGNFAIPFLLNAAK